MKAIVVQPTKPGAWLAEVADPSPPGPAEVLLRVLRTGICGTDREIAKGYAGLPPQGEDLLVIGHELLGQVVAVGQGVFSVKEGDLAAFTVRRGCGTCTACRDSESDMCSTGNYQERGIKGLHGYMTELVKDREEYLVKLPAELAELGVLIEPTSVVEKAVEQAALRFRGLPLDCSHAGADDECWARGKVALVAGLGPIGLLAAMVLRLKDVRVFGLDVVDTYDPKAELLRDLEASYLRASEASLDAMVSDLGGFDIVIEATGFPQVAFNLSRALHPNGVCVFTGIPGGDRPVDLEASLLMRTLVLGNQAIIGSVNANKRHFTAAARDLLQGRKRFGRAIDGIITHVSGPAGLLSDLAPPEGCIKEVIDWRNQ